MILLYALPEPVDLAVAAATAIVDPIYRFGECENRLMHAVAAAVSGMFDCIILLI